MNKYWFLGRNLCINLKTGRDLRRPKMRVGTIGVLTFSIRNNFFALPKTFGANYNPRGP